MIQIVFILDLTRGIHGIAETVDSCRNLEEKNWQLLAAFSDSAGAAAAHSLAATDARIQELSVGSGTGSCDWRAAVAGTEGPFVVFLLPGDCLMSDALASWNRGLAKGDDALWVLGSWSGAPYSDWWLQRDLAGSAAPLLLIGAVFPECAALVRRDAWLTAAANHPATMSDSSRASAWLALALLQPPVLLSEAVSVAALPPSRIDADMVVRVLEGLARRDPLAAGRIVADVSRIGAGMRVAQEALFGVLRLTERCFGLTPPKGPAVADWLPLTQFLQALLARGDRTLWIWGAGSLGRQALAWLSGQRIPVAGFLDSDSRRDGGEFACLPVRHGDSVLQAGAAAENHPLIVIASMHHASIASGLCANGWHEGDGFIVFRSEGPVSDGDAHA